MIKGPIINDVDQKYLREYVSFDKNMGNQKVKDYDDYRNKHDLPGSHIVAISDSGVFSITIGVGEGNNTSRLLSD